MLFSGQCSEHRKGDEPVIYLKEITKGCSAFTPTEPVRSQTR